MTFQYLKNAAMEGFYEIANEVVDSYCLQSLTKYFPKIEKISRIEQDQKTLISVFVRILTAIGRY